MTARAPTFARIAGACALALMALAVRGPAQAEEIAVSNFGVSANGMPYGVALAKGFFKEEGANVTGIITSAGGGTSLRNMLAGGVPMARSIPAWSVAAIQQGADLKLDLRQRAHGCGVRLGGAPRFTRQVDQGLQGQEDRLHQSALDQPGARHAAARQGRPQGRRCRASAHRRLRRGGRGARHRAGRYRAAAGTVAVAVPGEIPHPRPRERAAAAARQRGRRRRRPTWRPSAAISSAPSSGRDAAPSPSWWPIRTRPATSSPRTTASRPPWRGRRCAISPPATPTAFRIGATGQIHLDGMKRMIEVQTHRRGHRGRCRLWQDHRPPIPSR